VLGRRLAQLGTESFGDDAAFVHLDWLSGEFAVANVNDAIRIQARWVRAVGVRARRL